MRKSDDRIRLKDRADERGEKFMTKKKYRELTVGEYGGYGRRVTPMIRLNGLWLEEAGFHAGNPILVKCENGKLIITQDRARAEMLDAEKAFMEEETKKLRKMFLKERKDFHERLVAERQEEYGRTSEAEEEPFSNLWMEKRSGLIIHDLETRTAGKGDADVQ